MMTFKSYTLRLFVNYPRVLEINIGYIIINSLIFTIFAPINSLMTKSTRDVSTYFVLNHLQKHSFHLYFSKILLPWEGGNAALPDFPPVRERCSLTSFGLHLDFYLATPLISIRRHLLLRL